MSDQAQTALGLLRRYYGIAMSRAFRYSRWQPPKQKWATVLGKPLPVKAVPVEGWRHYYNAIAEERLHSPLSSDLPDGELAQKHTVIQAHWEREGQA